MDCLFPDPDPSMSVEEMMKNPFISGFFKRIPNGDPSKGIMTQVSKGVMNQVI